MKKLFVFAGIAAAVFGLVRMVRGKPGEDLSVEPAYTPDYSYNPGYTPAPEPQG